MLQFDRIIYELPAEGSGTSILEISRRHFFWKLAG